jgi:DNA polymerase I-like protein with 3'-5' exonuclease and polymerase domains
VPNGDFVVYLHYQITTKSKFIMSLLKNFSTQLSDLEDKYLQSDHSPATREAIAEEALEIVVNLQTAIEAAEVNSAEWNNLLAIKRNIHRLLTDVLYSVEAAGIAIRNATQSKL